MDKEELIEIDEDYNEKLIQDKERLRMSKRVTLVACVVTSWAVVIMAFAFAFMHAPK